MDLGSEFNNTGAADGSIPVIKKGSVGSEGTLGARNDVPYFFLGHQNTGWRSTKAGSTPLVHRNTREAWNRTADDGGFTLYNSS
ncbi:MAG: hypothetical protein M3R08_08250, partial [Bacteroidota bacterium]|nr:hypothetical protein [Bacteroidota bacterium]